MKWALGTVAVLAVVAGCGGSPRSDTAAIRAALAASPDTYLHYGARTWGRQPQTRVRIRINGDSATAVLSPTGTIAQRITLRRQNGEWRIGSAGEPGVISGPRAQRPATAAELAAISTVARSGIFDGRDSCITYRAQISTLDPRYAGVQYAYRKPYGTCLVGNGVSVFVRSASSWRHLEDASTPFLCNSLPPGVVRSLYGVCMTFR